MIHTTVDITLDTPISDRHKQVGEDEWSSEPITFGDAIVAEAARQLLSTLTADERTQMRRLVMTELENEVAARIIPLVQEALTQTFQPTNTLGEPIGKPLSLRQMIVDQAAAQLKPTPSHSLSRDDTALSATIKQITSQAIRAELGKELDEAKATIKAKVTDVVGETLTDAIIRKLS